jgi:putative membrane protein
MVMQSLEGLPAFVAYFCLTAVAVIAFLLIYTRITPYNEFELIRKNGVGAAIALGLSLLGFALPLASAVAHAADLVDCAIWAVIALVVQLITFYAARIPVPDLSGRIAAGGFGSVGHSVGAHSSGG